MAELYFRQLATFARVVRFDRRGTGASESFMEALERVGISIRCGVHTGEIEMRALTSGDERSTLRLAYSGLPVPARSSHRAPCGISLPAPISSSTTGGSTS